jgi:co-chaperonin GroES (HSP10)
MTKRFRPLSDSVLVKVEAVAAKTGGLAVPKQQEEEPTQGVVVAAGPKALKSTYDAPRHGFINPDGVAIGERVQWRKYSGHETMHNGEKHRLLRLEELDGIIEEGDD